MAAVQADLELVRQRLKKTRTLRKMSLRDVGAAIGVSPATLSRIERGAGTPDLQTLDTLIDWLELDRRAVFVKQVKEAASTPERVAVLLRADKNLDAATAKALSTIFKTAYKELASG